MSATIDDIPRAAQSLGNLFGCLEHFAYHARAAKQSGEQADVKTFLDEIDPEAESLARKIAAKFAESYPDLEPLIKDRADSKDFTPFTKSLNPKEAPVAQATKKKDMDGDNDGDTEDVKDMEEGPTLPGHVVKAIRGAAAHCMKMYGHKGLEDDEEMKAECYHHGKALDGILEGDEGRTEGDEEEMTEEEEEHAKKILAKMQRRFEANKKTIETLGVQ